MDWKVFFSELGMQVLVGAVFGILCFVGGMFYENAKDVIRGKKDEERLKQRIKIALDCVFEAEVAIPGDKKGADKLEFATKLYQDRAKVRRYEEAHAAIMQAFTVSKLDRNGHTL